MKYVDACRFQQWHLMMCGENGCIEEATPVEYHCRSWRHEGACRMWRGKADYERVRVAINQYSAWTYVVLTFAQSEWWDWLEQYKLGCPMWSAMRLRIKREFGPFGYIQTWERHQKGGLHVNVLIQNQELYEEVAFDVQAIEELWLSPTAMAIGFGPVCWVSNLREGTAGGMAGYLTKTAAELTGSGKKNQIPFDAPPHFRRLRASKGMLPPPYKSGRAGWLVMLPLDNLDRNHRALCPDSL